MMNHRTRRWSRRWPTCVEACSRKDSSRQNDRQGRWLKADFSPELALYLAWLELQLSQELALRRPAPESVAKLGLALRSYHFSRSRLEPLGRRPENPRRSDAGARALQARRSALAERPCLAWRRANWLPYAWTSRLPARQQLASRSERKEESATALARRHRCRPHRHLPQG